MLVARACDLYIYAYIRTVVQQIVNVYMDLATRDALFGARFQHARPLYVYRQVDLSVPARNARPMPNGLWHT